ncbi:MAG: hypothetical protein OEW83_02855 [Acidimicrobiia bacterium]|nr:hypothetical protein [Acidimicrobiia bacterium]
MVIYRGSDGKPGYHQTDDIHDAVGFVEQMRNDQGVEHARIFRLEEVVFQYKPYYRVELAESGFGELGIMADTANDGGTANDVANGVANGSANGSTHSSSTGSANGELTISANGGGSEASSGDGSSDKPTPVATGSASSASGSATTTSTDDGSGSKRGLFGR